MKISVALTAFVLSFALVSIADAQVGNYYPSAPIIRVAPTVTYYAPAAPSAGAAPVTTYYAPSPAVAVAPTTTYYAPRTAYYPPAVPAVPVTTYYAPVRPGLFGWRWRAAYWNSVTRPTIQPY